MLWVDGCVAGEKERKVKIYPSNLDKNPSQWNAVYSNTCRRSKINVVPTARAICGVKTEHFVSKTYNNLWWIYGVISIRRDLGGRNIVTTRPIWMVKQAYGPVPYITFYYYYYHCYKKLSQSS
jgi:hypothetical protein